MIRYPLAALVGSLFLVAAVPPIAAEERESILLVDADRMVHRGSGLPQVEPILAAHPTDPDILLGSTIAFAENGRTRCLLFTSHDGGAHWRADSTPAAGPFDEMVDPQVAFGRDGRAYFVSLVDGVDEAGRYAPALHVHRSEDDGRSWRDPVVIAGSWDHEQVAVDLDSARFAGHLYVAAMTIERLPEPGRGNYRLVLFRSSDGGQTFDPKVDIVDGGGDVGLNVMELGVDTAGTLYVLYADFPYGPTRSADLDQRNVWIVRSDDGGETFGTPALVGRQRVVAQAERDLDDLGLLAMVGSSEPTLAIDRSSGPHRDRLYAVWDEAQGRALRIVLSRSDDGGSTWSAPRIVAPFENPENGSVTASHQFVPTLAIGPEGVLGISWLDTRHGADDTGYDLLFTASLDGGSSFLAPARVSSARSRPAGAGNLTPVASSLMSPRGRFVFAQPAFARWPNGGDYAGLAASADGAFHAFWPDSRRGVFQTYTARIRIRHPTSLVLPEATALAEAVLEGDVVLRFELGTFDVASRRLELVTRLHNEGSKSVYGPITLEVRSLVDQRAQRHGDFAAPAVQNADNLEPGAGARFDYTETLGADLELEPGESSRELIWELTVPTRLPMLMAEVEIRGRRVAPTGIQE